MTKTSPNVYLFLLFRFIYGIGESTFFITLLTPLLNAFIPGASWVGYAEGAQGVAQGVVAIPVGRLADKNGPFIPIRVGAVLILLSSVVLAVIINMNLVPFSIYYVMLAGLIGVGFGQGIYSAALFTVFSDSIPTGKRTEWMSYARISYYIGTLTGPIMSIVILKLHGNDRWTLDDLLLPSTIGIVIFGLSLLVTFFFRESWKLAQESENIQKELSRRGNAAKKFLWFSSDKHVPYLLCIADVLCCVPCSNSVSCDFAFLVPEIFADGHRQDGSGFNNKIYWCCFGVAISLWGEIFLGYPVAGVCRLGTTRSIHELQFDDTEIHFK
eukprot:TRINITY_DN4208_c0_g1_i6.p1 TRINITY_DN4208_c0_g1~~TRINITY_DN4208_c0_g1_i6.p1  ORF type:complete len:326 (-),score=34.08 TRINITY_DN4208_c0_g1_i6:425-1402(-)